MLKNLYYKELLSVPEIARKIGCSVDAVYYFMRRRHLPRRDMFEESKRRFAQKPLSFVLKTKLSKEEEKLKLAGIMLYWAEGYKTDKSGGIDFANSDQNMVIVFMRFLRIVCGISEDRLRFLLYCYSNQNPNTLVTYWSDLISVKKSQFSKPYVRQDHSKEKYGKMEKGMIHIRYADKKLLWLVKKWIEEYKIKLCAGTQAVNEGSL